VWFYHYTKLNNLLAIYYYFLRKLVIIVYLSIHFIILFIFSILNLHHNIIFYIFILYTTYLYLFFYLQHFFWINTFIFNSIYFLTIKIKRIHNTPVPLDVGYYSLIKINFKCITRAIVCLFLNVYYLIN